MPTDFNSLLGLSPEELRRRFSTQQLREMLSEAEGQLQTPTGAPAISTEESGVDFLDRAKLGFAVGDEGKANILRSSGYQPVRLPTGGLGVRGKDGVVRPVDEEGFDLGDLADFVGDVPEVAGGIAGGMGGAGAGFFGGGPVPSFLMGTAGSSAGSAAGEGIRQQIGQYFGSGEEADVGKIGQAAMWGAAGEVGGRAGAGFLKKLAAPFKSSATQRIGAVEQGARALDQQFGTDVAGKMPLSTRTESPILGAIEQRVSTMAPNIDKYQKEVAEPFQGELVKLYDKIADTAGPRSDAQGAGDAVLAAAGETLEKRQGVVEQAYAELENTIPPDMPAFADNTRKAIMKIQERMGVLRGTKFKTGKEAAQKLEDLMNDADQVRTFADLEELGKVIGAQIGPGSEEFARLGLKKKVAGVYAALMEDIQRVAGEVGPDAVTKESTARGLAKSGFDLDRASITNLLRDPDKVANLADRLSSKNLTGAQIRRFKEKIGALGTDAGLPATAEGKAAWQQIGAEVMANLRKSALNDQLTTTARPVLSSIKLLSALEGAGGEDVLTEILGKQTTSDLYRFAELLRDTGKSERMFRNFSNTGQAVEAENLIGNLAEGPRGMLKAGAGILAKLGMGRAVMTPGGQQWLTQGVMQSPAQQSILSIMGRLPAQEFATSRTTQPKRRNK